MNFLSELIISLVTVMENIENPARVHEADFSRKLYQSSSLLSTLQVNSSMEKFNFGYSIKNIAIPSERAYKIQLMQKIELVIKRMKWKVIFASEGSEEFCLKEQNTYRLKSPKCPPIVKELSAFENDLCELVNKIKFRRYNCEFQNKLNKDIWMIKSSTSVHAC